MEAVYSSSGDLAILLAVFGQHIFRAKNVANSDLPEDIERIVGTSITQFLTEQTETNWKRMRLGINDFLVNGQGGIVQNLTGLRVLVTVSDGTVAYDSSKNTNNTNTFNNFKVGSINENHNTRPGFMAAILSNQGNGYEVKQSRSTLKKEAGRIQRIGSSTETLGCIRITVETK